MIDILKLTTLQPYLTCTLNGESEPILESLDAFIVTYHRREHVKHCTYLDM